MRSTQCLPIEVGQLSARRATGQVSTPPPGLASIYAGWNDHQTRFHDVLGEGPDDVRNMLRVASTTVPGLPLDAAGWEDDEGHPRSAAELVAAFQATWRAVEDCLLRWRARRSSRHRCR
jgi:hypothetical protein